MASNAVKQTAVCSAVKSCPLLFWGVAYVIIIFTHTCHIVYVFFECGELASSPLRRLSYSLHVEFFCNE